MSKKPDEDSADSIGTNIGEGIGCFFILIGIAILFSFPAVLALIGKFAGKCN